MSLSGILRLTLAPLRTSILAILRFLGCPTLPPDPAPWIRPPEDPPWRLCPPVRARESGVAAWAPSS